MNVYGFQNLEGSNFTSQMWRCSAISAGRLKTTSTAPGTLSVLNSDKKPKKMRTEIGQA